MTNHQPPISAVNGNQSQVRFRKISRLYNVMSDETYTHNNGEWTRFYNVSGMFTTLSKSGDLSNPSYNAETETRTTRDAAGESSDNDLLIDVDDLWVFRIMIS